MNNFFDEEIITVALLSKSPDLVVNKKIFEQQGRQIARELYTKLPAGTLDMVVIYLLRYKLSWMTKPYAAVMRPEED